MFSESMVRKVLVVTVLYNLIGALAFMFPGTIGGFAGLPAPFIYSWLVGGIILLLGAVAVWQLLRHPIDLPLLTLFGIAKVAFFLMSLIAHQLGEMSLTGVVAASADLVMGAIFLGHVWLASRG